MAMKELRKLTRDRDDEEEEEIWATHYSSNHQILLVGEGDFSFSCSLATTFGAASNICASSLDSYDEVVRKYKEAKSNLETLRKLGASLLHGVDATKLQLHPDLKLRRFDRVIYNFPHAGFNGKESDSKLIREHRRLVFGFFHCARHMLRGDGQIHVTHMNKAPYCHWNLEELASKCSLVLIRCVPFYNSKYPGYENKRGDGSRCDEPFPLGECFTFKFGLSDMAKELYAEKVQWRLVKEGYLKCPEAFSNGDIQRPGSFELRRGHQEPLFQTRQRPSPFDLGYYQDHTCSQYQDYSIQPEKLLYSEGRSLFFQDRARGGSTSLDRGCYQNYRFSQFEDASVQAMQRPVSFALKRNYDRFLMERDFPTQTHHHPQEESLFCQDFPVQASQDPLFQPYNGRRTMLSRTTFPPPCYGESREPNFISQRNLNIW